MTREPTPTARYALAHYVWEEDLGPGKRPLSGPGSAIVETVDWHDAVRMIDAALPGRIRLREVRSLEPIGNHVTHVVSKALLRRTRRESASKLSAGVPPATAVPGDARSRGSAGRG
jgi:hypothetical protein